MLIKVFFYVLEFQILFIILSNPIHVTALPFRWDDIFWENPLVVPLKRREMIEKLHIMVFA